MGRYTRTVCVDVALAAAIGRLFALAADDPNPLCL